MFSISSAIYIVLAIASIWVSVSSYRLARTYRSPFLYYLFIWILSAYIFAFFDLLGRDLTRRLLNVFYSPERAGMLFEGILNLLAIPFVVISGFYFIRFFLALINKRFHPFFQILYFLTYVVMTGIYFVFLLDVVRNGLDDFSPHAISCFSVFDYIIRLIYIIPLLMVLLGRIEDKSWRKGVRVMSGITLVLILASLWLIKTGTNLELRYYSYLVSSVLIPLLPFLYFRFFYIQYLKKRGIPRFETDFLQEFFQANKITPREQEVIKLVIEGKTNAEIEQLLYISLQTVKSHIYNVFKKLNVSNRHQLINLVNHFESEKPS